MKHLLLGILLVALLFGCKKKKEEEPYVPVKQTYTDIPGTDIYITNTDSAFVDTGLVITIKGKGFDPKFKNHYTLNSYDFKVFYSNDNLPEIPKMIYFDDTTIKFKYPPKHFFLDSCGPKAFKFVFVKYSDDPMAELNYQKRFLAASPLRTLVLNNFYEITKDTTFLTKWTGYQEDVFINFYGLGACNLDLCIDDKCITQIDDTRTGVSFSWESYCHFIGIPTDLNYGISDGFHTVKLLKNGKEVFRNGKRDRIYVKSVK